jgi:hypothetical protein
MSYQCVFLSLVSLKGQLVDNDENAWVLLPTSRVGEMHSRGENIHVRDLTLT